jgi:8-oxo-dGTP pyrophosphatase MutT (NUDIX family)
MWMNWLHYRLLLEERWPHHYKYHIKRASRKIDIEVLDKKTNQPVVSKNEEGGPARLQLLKRDDNAYWEVAVSASPLNSKGVGLELYKMALELASFNGISPDSIETSADALKIWNILGKLPSITREKKEEFEYEGDEDPFFFIHRKKGEETLDQNDVSYEKVEDEPQEKEAEPDISDRAMGDIWDELDDLDEQLDKNDSKKVSKVIILDKNHHILLLKRSDGSKYWDLPGGHLKKDEKPEDGAERETKEETNLNISGLKHVQTKENVKFYKANTTKTAVTLDPEEHQAYEWVKIDDLDKYTLYPGAKSIVQTAIKTLEEDYQQDVKKGHRKMKIRLIATGPNKYKGAPFVKKPSYKRSKSAPAGFGGS